MPPYLIRSIGQFITQEVVIYPKKTEQAVEISSSPRFYRG